MSFPEETSQFLPTLEEGRCKIYLDMIQIYSVFFRFYRKKWDDLIWQCRVVVALVFRVHPPDPPKKEKKEPAETMIPPAFWCHIMVFHDVNMWILKKR